MREKNIQKRPLWHGRKHKRRTGQKKWLHVGLQRKVWVGEGMPQSPWDAQQGEAVMSGDRQQVEASNFLLSQTNCSQLTEKCRTLIVHRDEGGYGLTLSGDRPTRVQTVKVLVSTQVVRLKIIQTSTWQAGGASHRAGVREGDVIIKVNGQQVFCCQFGNYDILFSLCPRWPSLHTPRWLNRSSLVVMSPSPWSMLAGFKLIQKWF